MKSFKVHAPGTKVYAICRAHLQNEGDNHPHAVIVPLIVNDVNISQKDGIEYYLRTPNKHSLIDSPFPASEVSTMFDVLALKMRKEWNKLESYE